MEDDLLIQPLVIQLIGCEGEQEILCQIHIQKLLKAKNRSPVVARNHVYLFSPQVTTPHMLSICFSLFKDIIIKYKAPYYVISFALKFNIFCIF